MSAENRVTIFIVKRKRGRKGQTIFIVKYMQNWSPNEFTDEELARQLAGSLYTTKFNVAFAMAKRICSDLIYTEYGVTVCKKYKNVYVSTTKLDDPEEAKMAVLPCLKDNLHDFVTRFEFFVDAQGGYTAIGETMSHNHVFFELLRLKQNEHVQKYWLKDAYDSEKKFYECCIEKNKLELETSIGKLKQNCEEEIAKYTAKLIKLEENCHDENYWMNKQ